jgi:hypothetical protein
MHHRPSLAENRIDRQRIQPVFAIANVVVDDDFAEFFQNRIDLFTSERVQN